MSKNLPAQSRPVKNNTWYQAGDSDTVIVFVHGIFSDSVECWTYRDRKTGRDVFWPELITAEPVFQNPGIYMGGFYTAVDSADYGVEDAAKELFSGLRNPMRPGGRALDRRNVLFICHSTGGIVVRHMLYHRHTVFSDKTVGLLLIASPSFGAWHARKLTPIAQFFKHRMGKQLRLGSDFLQSLEDNFKDLLHDEPRRIPRLIGAEWAEHHFLWRHRWIPPLRRVVDPGSAGRYFGSVRKIPGTDHSSIVKPDSQEHPSHRALREFYSEQFRRLAEKAEPTMSVVQSVMTTHPVRARSSAAGLRVAVSVVAKGSHVLLVKRRDDLTWTFPSGIIKPGGDPSVRAAQTVMEETGVTCEVIRKVGERRHPRTRVHAIYFECRYVQGEADNRDRNEHLKARWVPADQVFRYNSEIYPKVQRLLAKTSRLKPEERVAIAIVHRDGQVLMVRRTIPEDTLEWHFPGGRIEEDEQEQEAIEREVYEETGVSCKAAVRLHERDHPGTGAAVVYWGCTYFSGEPKVREPNLLDRVTWLTVSEALAVITSDLAEPVREYMSHLGQEPQSD